MGKESGMIEPCREQANLTPLFRVAVNKHDQSYTLLQEGIILTEEQARQIATAYIGQNERILSYYNRPCE